MPGGREREMRREHAFFSKWCTLFEFHLKRLRWSASDFATRANRSQQAIHSYLCGRARPPLDQVPIWAAMLGLRGEERDRFVSSAAEAHVPPPVWRRLQDLERATRAGPGEPTAMETRIVLAEGAIQELVGILRDIEGLFYMRDVPVDRIAAVRSHLGTAIRRAIERYARTVGP